MIVRVVQKSQDVNGFVGNFETSTELPAVGDTFWYDKRGPYKVISRAFVYKEGREGDPAEDVILTVKPISAHL